MSLRRFTKQLVVAGVFFAFLGGLAALLYLATRPAPSCFDGLQNQNEEGADCGGVCQLACRKEPRFTELLPGSTMLFATGENSYDVAAEVENRNLDFGASSFQYEFTLFDSASSVIAARQGESYILPGERKLLVEQRLGASRPARWAALKISAISWTEVKIFPTLELVIRDKSLTALPDGTSRASALVLNQSGANLRQIDLTVVLRDDPGKVLAVGKTDVQIIRDTEQRYFELRWPSAFKNVAKVEMAAHTNVFLNANFLKRYGIEHVEPFQKEVPSVSATPRRHF